MWMSMSGHGHHLASRVYNYLEDIQPGLAHKAIGGVVTSAALSYLAVRGYRYYRSRQIAKERGLAAKQACQKLSDYLNQLEAKEGGVNRQKEAMIVGLDTRDLRDRVQKGELKAVEVLRAFQRKALEVNDQLNCITEPIAEAEARAKELDSLKPNQSGPLHGLPVSIKESIFIKGYDCNIGFSCLANKPVEQDADIVQPPVTETKIMKILTDVPNLCITQCTGKGLSNPILLANGLLVVRELSSPTRYPETKRCACSNPIYGQTHNPHNLLRGPGGSSGGEGALLGAGGSILGIGSDIGGSIRIPAQFCGAYGLKPTVDRFITKGHIPLISGQTLVRATCGPMARDMEGLILMSREVLTPRMHSIDPVVPPVPFRDELLEGKAPLCIGFYTAFDGLAPHHGSVRAVMEAKAALERKGHKVIKFQPPRPYDAFAELLMKAVFADDGEDMHKYFKDDVLDGCISTGYYMGTLPWPMKYVLAKLKGFVDPPGSQMAVATCRLPKRIIDWWYLQDKIQAYKAEFLEAWQSLKLDALLCPGLPFPALTAGIEYLMLMAASYTALFNLLNYPAGSVPVSTITEQDIQRVKDPSVYPRFGAFEKIDSEGTVGLPMGVQCVSLPYHEEIVLRVMKDIDSAMRE